MSEKTSQITRVSRSKEQARQSYNRLSRWYDVMAGQSEKKYRREGLRLLDIKEGEKVLEIGFGTGHSAVAMAQKVGNEGKVYGIDISDGMLGMAMSRVSKAGFLEKVELRRGDAAALPYEDGAMDAVYISFTLELFDTPEIPVVLKECMRVLGSGGRIAVVSMSAYGAENSVMKIYKWAHKSFPQIVDCRPIYARKSLQEAGFSIREDELMTMWGLPVEVVLAQKEG